MKRLYDVQQLLKRFGIIVYMGNRLYDIEMMQIELNRIYQAGVLDRLEYMEAELVLRREHRLELEYQKSRRMSDGNILGILVFWQYWEPGWVLITGDCVVQRL